MKNVLVVEDEVDVRDLLTLHLKREGYTVSAFEDAEDALAAFEKLESQNSTFDLIILDWMLPQMSGLDFCKAIRSKKNSSVPILILTARADTMDKVLGLEMGADDYLTKPFEVREFVARVRALLRRSTTSGNEGEGQKVNQKNILVSGPFKLDLGAKQVFLEEQKISLTPNEYKLLATLMQKAGITFEREKLIELIQGPGVAVVDRTIDTSILGLRKKLGPHADWVETVRGFGYRFRG